MEARTWDDGTPKMQVCRGKCGGGGGGGGDVLTV